MKDRIAAAALKSATVYNIYIVILVIAGELSGAFNKFLAGLTGHHWITKSVTGLVLFILLTILFSRMNDDDVEKGIKYTMWSVVAGFIIIFGFFLIHG